MIGFKDEMSIRLDSYDLGIWPGPMDSSKMWGTVVCPLLETSSFVYTRFLTISNGLVGLTCVVVYTVDTEHIADALGIRGA